MLVFTTLQEKYYEILQTTKGEMEDQELKTLIKDKNRDAIQTNYLNARINQNFKLYAQYLRLTNNSRPRFSSLKKY